jgi:hypothetical protein
MPSWYNSVSSQKFGIRHHKLFALYLPTIFFISLGRSISEGTEDYPAPIRANSPARR